MQVRNDDGIGARFHGTSDSGQNCYMGVVGCIHESWFAADGLDKSSGVHAGVGYRRYHVAFFSMSSALRVCSIASVQLAKVMQ